MEEFTCFVMQPFDKGKFDKRFKDVFKPAIEKAGGTAYRVDTDPSVSIPINAIEHEIKNAEVCLADITTDNPNVWFELGYALALNKDVIMVSGDERTTKYPFDVQHRSIIGYKTESSGDFAELSKSITARLDAILKKRATLSEITPASKAVSGLTEHEISVLTILMAYKFEPELINFNILATEMEKAGFNKIASTLGLQSLVNRGFSNVFRVNEDFGSYDAFEITQTGLQWVLDNQETLNLRA